jgi:PST family polysaccharide transporter
VTLFKTTFWAGIATIIRLMTGFVSAKVLAVYIGPGGFAIVGQFQNFVQMVLTFSGNMIQAGVVKYVAEYRDNAEEKAKMLSTGLWLAVISSLVIGILLFSTQSYWAELFLKDRGWGWIVGLFGVTLILFVLNTFIISIINGHQDIKRYTAINVFGTLVGLGVTILLVTRYRLEGALLSSVMSQSVVFAFTLLFLRKCGWLKKSNFNLGIDKASLFKYMRYAAMAITSTLCIPTSQLVLRSYVIHHFSLADAGYWQAVTRISDAYLMLITTTLSVYYLPKLSSLIKRVDILKEMRKAYLTIFPLTVLFAAGIFIFKREIILILFSPAFLPMMSLFLFQLLGDVFKIGSWLFAFNMLAKAQTRLFMISEIVFSISFVCLSVLFSNWFGLMGVTMGFAVNYLLYWVVMGFVFCKKIK